MSVLTSLPEELLERILVLAVLPPSSSLAQAVVAAPPPTSLPRSSSAPFPCRSNSSAPRSTSLQAPYVDRRSVNKSTPLLTNKQFARIGMAVLFTHIHLLSREQCISLTRTLSARADLASRIRSLRVDGAWPEVYDLLRAIKDAGSRMAAFDMAISAMDRRDNTAASASAGIFCDALALLPSLGTVKSLAVRKAADAYITLPGPAGIIECLSELVGSWDSLETINIGFRLPSGPRRTVSPPLLPMTPAMNSPCVKLVSALARSPSLKIVCTHLPAAWNSSLLEISANPSLAAIRLDPSPPVVGPHHMFLTEAIKYPRLAELIKAGSRPASPSLSAYSCKEPATTNAPGQTSASGRLRANTITGTVARSSSTVVFPSTVSPAEAEVPVVSQSPQTTHIAVEPVTSAATDSASAPRSEPAPATVQKPLSRRRSGKGHTRQTPKWSRRISVV